MAACQGPGEIVERAKRPQIVMSGEEPGRIMASWRRTVLRAGPAKRKKQASARSGNGDLNLGQSRRSGFPSNSNHDGYLILA